MTPTQQAFASRALRAMAEFYENPENERRFQKWKQSKEAGAHTATNEPRATPAECPYVGAQGKS